MKILITGVSGFVGTHLAKLLLKNNYCVYGFDIRSPRLEIDFIQGDLVSQQGFDSIPWKELDVVFHLASIGVKPDSRDWAPCVEVNVLGTHNLLEKMRAEKSSARLIYTNSFYEKHIFTHSDLKKNPYIETKFVATQMVRSFASSYFGRVITLTLFQVYGPGDANTTVLPYVANQLANKRKAILGSGSGVRDWVFIDDVISALFKAIHVNVKSSFSEYDIGTGLLVSLRDITKKLAVILDGVELLEFDSQRDRPDLDLKEKAKTFLPNWKCEVNIEEGLKKLSSSFLNRKNR